MENDLYKAVEEVKPQGSFVAAVTFKPKMPIVICMVMGILFLFVSNLYVRLLGVFFFLMGLFVLLYVKDYKILDIFDQGLMIYGDREMKTACFLNWDDISEWDVDRSQGHDLIEIDLNDGRKIFKDTFEADKVFRQLNIYIRKKNRRFIRTEKSKTLSLPEAARNIREQFRKK